VCAAVLKLKCRYVIMIVCMYIAIISKFIYIYIYTYVSIKNDDNKWKIYIAQIRLHRVN
jgi:hypothetical protein